MLSEQHEAPAQVEPLCIDQLALAAMLDVSVRTLRRLNDEGKVPAPLNLRGHRRWLREEIVAWLRAGAPARKQWNSMWRSSRSS